MFQIKSKSRMVVVETSGSTGDSVDAMEPSTFNMPPSQHDLEKQNKSDCWRQAELLFRKKLTENPKKTYDPKLIEEFLHFRSGLDNTIKICTSFKDQAEREYHKSDGSGKSTMAGKLLKSLTAVKEVGDPFLSAAPESVAIAWWAISSVVQVAMKDMEKCELVAGASESIVTMILNCRLFERRYAQRVEGSGDADTEFRILNAIPQVLQGVLEFAWYTSQTFFTKNKLERFFTISFSSTLKNLIDSITNDYQKLRVDTGDAFASRVMDQLETIFKQSGKSTENMKELLFPKLDEIKNLIQEFMDNEKKKADAVEIQATFKQKRDMFGPNDHHKKQLEANSMLFQLGYNYKEMSTWFFEGETYQMWQKHGESNAPSLLCVSAARGFGKSCMLTVALLRLQELQKSDDAKPIVLYFYFKKGDPATQLMVKGLESIVYQLLDDKTYITDANVKKKVTGIVDKARSAVSTDTSSKLEGAPAGGTSGHSDTKKKPGPDEDSPAINSPSTLKNIIEQVGKELDRPIYLVVDAVDECEDRAVDDSDLMKILKELTQSQGITVRAIISTRDGVVDKMLEVEEAEAEEASESEGESVYSSTVVVRLDEEANSADMERYLKKELTLLMNRRTRKAKNAAFEKELRWIIPSIKAKAKGSFTYASMVIASLEQPHRSTLRQMLQNLPEGMDELYRQSLGALTFDERSLITLALNRVVWGCGEVTAVEIAESFKRMYAFDDEQGGKELDDANIEAESVVGEDANVEEGEDKYDAAQDSEILDVISHLQRAGRDFLRVEWDSNVINIDTSIREWVIHEADIASKWQTEIRPMTDFFSVDDQGAWVLSLPIPAAVAHGKGSRADFQSKRDTYLDIALEILQTLNHKKFQERYMSQVADEDDEQATDGEEDGGKGETEDEGESESEGEDENKSEDEGEREGESESEGEDEVNGNVEHSDSVAVAKSKLEAEGATGLDEEAMSPSGQDATTVEGEDAEPADDEGDESGDESQISVDVEVDDEEEPTPRYELLHWLDHIKLLEDTWEVSERRGNNWKLLWERLEAFLTPEVFKNWHLQYDQFLWKHVDEETIGDRSQPLHFVAQKGILMVVQKLVEELKADVNARNADDVTPIYYSMNPTIVKYLLDHGAEINYVSSKNYTPMQHCLDARRTITLGEEDSDKNAAVDKEYMDTIELYIAAGADINLPDDDNWVPIFYAAESKDEKLFKLLIDHDSQKLDVAYSDLSHQTVLHYLFMQSEDPNLAVQFLGELIKAGADVNAQDAQSVAPLCLAAKCSNIEACEMLLEHGADVNDVDEWGFMAIHMACEYTDEDKQLEMVRVLLKHGGLLNSKDKEGQLPITYAVMSDRSELVKLLLDEWKKLPAEAEKPATVKDIEAATETEPPIENNTPVVVAIVTVEQTIKVTVEEAEVINPVPTDNGNSAMAEGEVGGAKDQTTNANGRKEGDANATTEDADQTGNAEANGTKEEADGENGEEEAVEDANEWLKVSLISREDFLTLQSSTSGYTLLFLSADRSSGGLEVAKLVLNECTPKQAKFLLETPEYEQGLTPLHTAARSGNVPMLQFLLEKGADINVLTRDGNSAIALASAKWMAALEEEDEALEEPAEAEEDPYEKCLMVLLGYAEAATSDSLGLLHSATARGSVEVLKKVATHGTRPDSLDEHAWSAAHYARVYRTQPVLQSIYPEFDITHLGTLATMAPSRFSATKKGEQMHISEDGMQCWTDDTWNGDTAAVIADHPVPADKSDFYYEMTVMEGDTEYPEVGLGFLSEDADFGKMPGWKSYPEYTSYGWHGDDGHVYGSSNAGRVFDPRRPTVDHRYNIGDTVGCGYDSDKDEIYYTHNGEYLGIAFSKVKSCRMFPAVGINIVARVSINFGSTPFQFKGERGPHLIRRASTGQTLKRTLTFSPGV